MSEFEKRSKSAKFLAIILQSNWTPNNQSNYLWNGKYVLDGKHARVLKFGFIFGFDFILAFMLLLLLHNSGSPQLLLLLLLIFYHFFFLHIFFLLFLIRFLRVLHWPSLHDNVWQSKAPMYTYKQQHISRGQMPSLRMCTRAPICYKKYDMGEKWKSFVSYWVCSLPVVCILSSFLFSLFDFIHYFFCVNLHNILWNPMPC